MRISWMGEAADYTDYADSRKVKTWASRGPRTTITTWASREPRTKANTWASRGPRNVSRNLDVTRAKDAGKNTGVTRVETPLRHARHSASRASGVSDRGALNSRRSEMRNGSPPRHGARRCLLPRYMQEEAPCHIRPLGSRICVIRVIRGCTICVITHRVWRGPAGRDSAWQAGPYPNPDRS